MDLDLAGKVALVTGGSRGIGLVCAQVLAAEGVKVAIVSRAQANIDRALTQIPGAYGRTADLIDAEDAAMVVADVVRRLGPIDILVNSAGAAKRTPPDDLTPALWRAAMDAKYFTYINVIDPVVKQMASRGVGVIINIIGIGGRTAAPTHLPGGAANAALMLATAGLAAAYAERGVRVIGLNPGHTRTERVEEGLSAEARLYGGSESEALARIVQRIPLGRLGESEEIANVVAFLASNKASYVTGVNISMDGGATSSVV
jgi:NAD(P)-dependent dehydrogenase (short-subunit alcohol dehydrogenase family)